MVMNPDNGGGRHAGWMHAGWMMPAAAGIVAGMALAVIGGGLAMYQQLGKLETSVQSLDHRLGRVERLVDRNFFNRQQPPPSIQ